jgi:histidinol-phosphate aminotransferase
MNPFWSQIACELSPYVPGEQPRVGNLVKLNTNESPFGPSPLALEAMRAAAADTLLGGNAFRFGSGSSSRHR